MPDKNKKSETKEDMSEKEQIEEDVEGTVASDKSECEKQRDEYLKGWQRAKADLINYKKEESDRLASAVGYATEDIIKDIISVADNFDLGIRALEKQGKVEKGVYMIRSSIEDILKKRGVERFSVNSGDEFDPNEAEAISTAESGEYPDGAVIEEIEPGYRINGKMIRPARVIVSKGSKK